MELLDKFNLVKEIASLRQQIIDIHMACISTDWKDCYAYAALQAKFQAAQDLYRALNHVVGFYYAQYKTGIVDVYDEAEIKQMFHGLATEVDEVANLFDRRNKRLIENKKAKNEGETYALFDENNEARREFLLSELVITNESEKDK